MDIFSVQLKKYIKLLFSFYIISCTLYILGVVLDKWIALGTVFGSMMILLFFFLSIPAAIVEVILKFTGSQFIGTIRLADTEPFISCVLLVAFNLLFSLILALVLSTISCAWKHLLRRIKRN